MQQTNKKKFGLCQIQRPPTWKKKKMMCLKENQHTPTPSIQSLKQPRRIIMNYIEELWLYHKCSSQSTLDFRFNNLFCHKQNVFLTIFSSIWSFTFELRDVGDCLPQWVAQPRPINFQKLTASSGILTRLLQSVERLHGTLTC